LIARDETYVRICFRIGLDSRTFGGNGARPADGEALA
jgi:hypothetical protein